MIEELSNTLQKEWRIILESLKLTADKFDNSKFMKFVTDAVLPNFINILNLTNNVFNTYLLKK